MNTNPFLPADIAFLERLKEHSSAAHKKLEGLYLSRSIIHPNLKIRDYCRYLSLMYDVHLSAEETIFPTLSNIISDLNERKKAHLLQNDLKFLECKTHESVSIFKNSIFTVPFALGILYVIEGSSLGGRFILKNVEKLPGLNAQQGVSYFTGYGDRTGSYWKAMTGYLTLYEEQHDCGDEIIEGAVYAFECIYNHFQKSARDEN